MGSAPTPAEKAAATDAAARDLLAAGNPAGALHEVIAHLKWALAQYRKDPAAGALMDAAVAGSLAPVAAALTDRKPPRVPGYAGGAPTSDDLLTAYITARTETERQQATGRRHT